MTRHWRINPLSGFGILWILVLLAGCGEKASLPALPTDGVILAFGDSLTHGTGAGPGEDYPALLAGLSGRSVINEGVPGEESDAALARLGAVLDETNPDLVILGHGGNDMLHKRDLSGTQDNLARMVQLAREHGASVVLLGIPKPGIFLAVHPMYPELAQSLNLPLESDALADILGDASLKSDSIHPNSAGYQALAQAIYRLLERAGAIQ